MLFLECHKYILTQSLEINRYIYEYVNYLKMSFVWKIPEYRFFSGLNFPISPITGKYGPKKLCIWTIFTHFHIHFNGLVVVKARSSKFNEDFGTEWL